MQKNLEKRPSPHHPPSRILLLDDDPDFGRMMKMAAENQSIDLRHCESLMDLGGFANLGSFDLIILDFFLEAVTADEIARYVEVFFKQTPIVIISSDSDLSPKVGIWPDSVKGFIAKDRNVYSLLKEAIALASSAAPLISHA